MFSIFIGYKGGTWLTWSYSAVSLLFFFFFKACLIKPKHIAVIRSNSVHTSIYSRLSLSRPRLFRITAYLEVKIWSLFCHGNLTTGIKILWRRGEIPPQEQFLLFSTIFSTYLLTSGVKLHIHLSNVVVRFIVFLNAANLICRDTDISKYSRGPLDFEITRVDCIIK